MQEQTNPTRSPDDYLKVGRLPVANHLQTELKKRPARRSLHKLTDFLSKTIWDWLFYYLQSRFGRKYPYPEYQGTETGIYNIQPVNNEEVTIGIASDWATDTTDAFAVSKRMYALSPEYTIHAGDTYYVGSPEEIYNNFLRPDAPWKKGSKGSFALLGNHEMYARGVAFFRDLLPALGIKNESGFTGQLAGYFCLETPYWRVIGLDTGYHSVSYPLLEMLPGFDPNCRLPEPLMRWLKNTVQLGNPADQRGILLISHHQYVSAFHEHEYLKPAEQLAELLGTTRPVVWLWGHEHKLAVYEKAQIGKGITAYGRCIGNGGTPVELSTASFIENPINKGYPLLLNVDKRTRKTLNQTPLGYNGFAFVKLHQRLLTLEYHDHTQLLLSEQWEVTGNRELQRKVLYTHEQLTKKAL